MNITELRTLFQSVRTTLTDNDSARFLPSKLSSQMDDWLRQTASSLISDSSSTLLLAVGGYGRGELFPQSDVDLLVSLGEDEAPDQEQLAKCLFMPLWDAGFDVGHGVRTPSETFTLATADFEVLCAFLDARLLAGNPETFESMQRGFNDAVLRPRITELVQWLAARFEARHDPGADSAHLLSPNIKEGRGGLRDYQTILWLDRIFSIAVPTHRSFLTAPEREALDAHAAFLSIARVHLHSLVKRKSDVLHLEMQPDVARVMGYERASRVEGVELFLSVLHQEMAEIKLLCRLTLNKAQAELSRLTGAGWAGQPDGLDFSILANNPLYILELFHHSAQTRIPISWQTRRIIQSRLDVLALDSSWHQPLTARFEAILCMPHAADALEQMMEIGFLGAYLPEFHGIEHLVQFDAYHLLPAGPHLVETVRQLCSYEATHPFLGEYLYSLAGESVLRWAALLHDIGKGNGEHSARGARMAKEILLRLGYEQDFMREVSFLIEEHLLLIHVATRQDLGEEPVIFQLSQKIGTIERLNALTLLTWADSNATGPKAWTPWIQNLLRESYFKTRRVLQRDTVDEDHSAQRLSKVRDFLRKTVDDRFSSQELERFLAVLPPRYLLQTKPEHIFEHMELVRSYRLAATHPFAISWHHETHAQTYRMTLVSEDRLGLFACISGALSKSGLSILAADLNVWDDGTVLDVLWVTEPLDLLYAEDSLKGVERSLARFLMHEEELDKVRTQINAKQKRVFSLDPELVVVTLDNSGSEYHTVLSIEAPDIKGLLATLSLTLYRMGLDVSFAKIATQKDKAVDIFHVRMNGQKIPEHELSALQNSLQLLVCSLYA